MICKNCVCVCVCFEGRESLPSFGNGDTLRSTEVPAPERTSKLEEVFHKLMYPKRNFQAESVIRVGLRSIRALST